MSPYLTTAAAADYCGFKTTGALRKARLEGRVFPVGRRASASSWAIVLRRFDRCDDRGLRRISS